MTQQKVLNELKQVLKLTISTELTQLRYTNRLNLLNVVCVIIITCPINLAGFSNTGAIEPLLILRGRYYQRLMLPATAVLNYTARSCTKRLCACFYIMVLSSFYIIFTTLLWVHTYL